MYSIDYQKTFSPVAKLTSIHVLIWFAATHHWLFHQLDIKNAFFMIFLMKRFIWS